MSTSTVIIFNPTARGDTARKLHRLLESVAREAVLRPTRSAGDATVLAAEAARDGFTTIVAAGGDGTVNEALNGLVLADRGLESARLAVLPLGTVNVFAKELGIPEDPAAAWQVVQAGRERRIDLPEATFQTDPSGGRTARRHFVQLAGAGLDSRAIAHVRWEEKKRLGQFAYAIGGFRALRERMPMLQIQLEDGTRDSGQLVLLGNGRLYGGHWPLFPEASQTDGLLDIVVVPRVSLFHLLGMVWSLRWGRFRSNRSVRHYQTARFSLEADGPCEFELEGDNVGFVPVTVLLRPKALRVVVP